MVALLIPGSLRAEAGGAGRIEVPEGGTLRTVFDRLKADWPRLERRVRDEAGEIRRYVNVYVDGEDVRQLAGLDTPVPPEAEVQILPSIAGG
ncbi:MAG TPA: ubiquitin-like small modifier protein 1 [Natronosporangium sp.]